MSSRNASQFILFLHKRERFLVIKKLDIDKIAAAVSWANNEMSMFELNLYGHLTTGFGLRVNGLW